ncbi:MAG TPA: Uma2 family endonuclease [Phycisphaerae bacterium]|nr:Uma2 family endonuclease [Phycisphaerae bacterium]
MTLASPRSPRSRSAGDPPPVRLTVAQYHRMIEEQILEEDTAIELLDGRLVHKDRAAKGEDPMTIGDQHVLVVKLLAALDAQVTRFGCHIQTQQPIALPPFSEPEPDGALIIGTPRDYAGKPGASDVLAVIEVADSSLQRDRTTKLRIYARAALPLYLIINLSERCIEQYTRPLPKAARYGHTDTLTPKQTLTLPLPKKKSLKLPVASLLP